MKIIKLDESLLDEVYFLNDRVKQQHYVKHVKKFDDKGNQIQAIEDGPLAYEPMSEDEYDELANKCSEADAASLMNINAPIVGFEANNGKLVKYNKRTKDLVTYIDDETGNGVISLYKQPIKKFYRKATTPGPFSYKKDLSK